MMTIKSEIMICKEIIINDIFSNMFKYLIFPLIFAIVLCDMPNTYFVKYYF